MSTPRPTIEVDALDLKARSWPNAVQQDYDYGRRYCFRLGKLEYVMWKWPWPERLGFPNSETLSEWLCKLYEWKLENTHTIDNAYIERCVKMLIAYI